MGQLTGWIQLNECEDLLIKNYIICWLNVHQSARILEWKKKKDCWEMTVNLQTIPSFRIQKWRLDELHTPTHHTRPNIFGTGRRATTGEEGRNQLHCRLDVNVCYCCFCRERYLQQQQWQWDGKTYIADLTRHHSCAVAAFAPATTTTIAVAEYKTGRNDHMRDGTKEGKREGSERELRISFTFRPIEDQQ